MQAPCPVSSWSRTLARVRAKRAGWAAWRCSLAALFALALASGHALAGPFSPPPLRVKPEKLQLRVAQAGEAFPPPPDTPLPIYIALAGPTPGPAVTLEVEADGAWEIWVQAGGEAFDSSFPAGTLYMAPVGTPPPAAGTPEPPWPWLRLTATPQLLASGQGRAELSYQVRLRLFGDEAVGPSARVDLTFTFVPLWPSG